MLNPLLQESISALSEMDTEKLEALCARAEALSAQTEQNSIRSDVEVRALKQTLFDLLRTTDENLRILRELRGLRASGLGGDAFAKGSARWVR